MRARAIFLLSQLEQFFFSTIFIITVLSRANYSSRAGFLMVKYS